MKTESILAMFCLALGVAMACRPDGASSSPGAAPGESVATYGNRRIQMVENQLAGRDITNQAVLNAMRTVPRHEFVPPEMRASAYADQPLPIGHGQTISQPYIVAIMTQLLELEPGDKILEVGTGSGYQAAVLAELDTQVYSIEIIEALATQARSQLKQMEYDNVHVRHGDGYKGWPEHAPFDGIIVTAAPDHVPQPLQDQLKEGGRLVIPVGGRLSQQLKVLTKKQGTIQQETLFPVRFVPLTGDHDHQEP